MAELERPDGTKIHYEIRGEEGPAILIAPWFSWTPGLFGALFDDLAADHRVVAYHARGTGNSSRNGPYDIETDVDDLEAVAEAAGGPVIPLSLADGSNRIAHFGARCADLVHAVATVGAPPLSHTAYKESDAMLSSEQTIEAFQGLVESNYRVAARHLVEGPNPQLSEDEVRRRTDVLVDFCPAEVALARIRAWTADDPLADAHALGDRLWVLGASETGGAWYPAGDELARMTARLLPEAHVERVDPGLYSNPDRAAEILRRITAPLRSGVAQARK